MFNERGRPNKKTNVSMLSNSIKTVVYELIQSHPSICSTHFWQNWWLHCQIGEIGGRSFHWNGWCWLLIWYAAHLKCRKIANDHYRRGKMRCMDGDGLFRLVWSACWCVCTFELIYDMLSNSHLKWVGVNDTHTIPNADRQQWENHHKRQIDSTYTVDFIFAATLILSFPLILNAVLSVHCHLSFARAL